MVYQKFQCELFFLTPNNQESLFSGFVSSGFVSCGFGFSVLVMGVGSGFSVSVLGPRLSVLGLRTSVIDRR